MTAPLGAFRVLAASGAAFTAPAALVMLLTAGA
jgi:hypothetical protein